MRRSQILLLVAGFVALVGCQGSTSTPPKSAPSLKTGRGPSADADPEVKEALAKLSPEDRKLAEAQKNCAVSGEPLGSMGTPIKLMLNGEPAFICCKSCQKRAEADPSATLKKVAELKTAAAK